MERAVTLRNLHKNTYPDVWHSTIGASFPSLHALIVSMLCVSPSLRPSASSIVGAVEEILGGYKVFSLTVQPDGDDRDAIYYLRVEVVEEEGILQTISQKIKKINEHVKIRQYSLKGEQEGVAVLEFAISINVCQELDELEDECVLNQILRTLNDDPSVQVARRVDDGRS